MVKSMYGKAKPDLSSPSHESWESCFLPFHLWFCPGELQSCWLAGIIMSFLWCQQDCITSSPFWCIWLIATQNCQETFWIPPQIFSTRQTAMAIEFDRPLNLHYIMWYMIDLPCIMSLNITRRVGQQKQDKTWRYTMLHCLFSVS